LYLLKWECFSAPGDLYVADDGTGSIFKYTPAGSQTTFVTGFFQPSAVAFDREANLFVADTGARAIVKVAPDGSKSTFAEVGVNFYGMAFDGGGNLYVSDALEILKFTPDGTQTIFAPDVENVWSLAFDDKGNLYAGFCGNEILKFAPDGSRSTFVSFSGANQCTTALAFDGEGNLFAKRNDQILKISPDGSSISTFATGDFQSNGLAFDAEGVLFAGLNAFNSNEPAIVKFAPDGTQTTFANGILLPAALAFEPVTEKLRNISARGLVGTGDDVLIGGFIVGGNALANNAVIVRAIGPSLSQSGVTTPLADPMLELHNSSGTLIASNDDWQETQKDQITAAGLAPTDPKESAIYATLAAGSYTAVVRGANETTGTALVEIYSVTE
jgi:sugar lactone lactonase YvrE